jgi:hypothetical protein
MRSLITPYPYRNVAHRVRTRTMASARSRQRRNPQTRSERHPEGNHRGSSSLRARAATARPALDRVRPLRLVPRGVIPYVKH